jgi:glyoxylase-like metal-dependent hydrolase (beta-lactamase superfamily II)
LRSKDQAVMIVLPAGNPSPWTGPTGTNTYLLPGERPALIDAGVGNPAHIDAIATGLSGHPLAAVLLTHSHSDHASGVPAVLARWPGAAVRPATAPFVDGERILAGDRTLTALHTPGHAPDHYAFFDEELGEAFTGDLLRIGGTVVVPGSRGGDLRAYLHSLGRIRGLQCRRLWPGHGPVIESPQKLIDEYLAHREARDAQIVAALRAGRTTPAEIVPVVYGGVSPALGAAAEDSVLAHLKKLLAEGRVELQEDKWRPL